MQAKPSKRKPKSYRDQSSATMLSIMASFLLGHKLWLEPRRAASQSTSSWGKLPLSSPEKKKITPKKISPPPPQKFPNSLQTPSRPLGPSCPGESAPPPLWDFQYKTYPSPPPSWRLAPPRAEKKKKYSKRPPSWGRAHTGCNNQSCVFCAGAPNESYINSHGRPRIALSL